MKFDLNMEDFGVRSMNDHEELVAYQHFSGLDIEEAEELINSNPSFYVDDLVRMGKVAFDVYGRAFSNFISNSNDPESIFFGKHLVCARYGFHDEPERSTNLITELAREIIRKEATFFISKNTRKEEIDDIFLEAVRQLSELDQN